MPATGWNALDGLLAARGVRFGPPTVGQTTGGSHAHGSYHYAGLARDYGSGSDLTAILATFRPYATGAGAPIVELFGLDTFLDDGRPFTPSADLRADHQTHVHAAIRPGAILDPAGALMKWAGAPAPAPELAADAGAAQAGGLVGAAQNVLGVFRALLDPTFWRRVGLVAGGAALAALGLALFRRDLIEGAVS